MAPPTITVVCVTRDHGPRVAEMLARVRPHVDEIVIAVDAKVAADSLGDYLAVADTVVRFDWRPPIDRERPWALELCTGDWILKLDGDEVPSARLLDLLPELVAAKDVAQYWIPCATLFPDAAHVLTGWPYSVYWVNRLIRNDPTLWHPGLGHTDVEPVWPSRYIDAPFYHLDCLLHPEGDRAAKVESYLAFEDELTDLAQDRWLIPNYLPERFSGKRTAPVPPEDRDAIDAVLAAGGRTAKRTSARAKVPYATATAVDAVWPERPLPDDAYRATLEPFDRERPFYVDDDSPFYVLVRNDGTEHWPGGESRKPLIRLGHRWLDADGNEVNSRRTMLPAPVAPGTEAIVPVFVDPPDREGSYVLEFDLVHELVRWFRRPLRLEVDLQPRSEDPTRRLLDEAPERRPPRLSG